MCTTFFNAVCRISNMENSNYHKKGRKPKIFDINFFFCISSIKIN